MIYCLQWHSKLSHSGLVNKFLVPNNDWFCCFVAVNEETSDIVCLICKLGESNPPNEIVICDKCGYGNYYYMNIQMTNKINRSVSEWVEWVCQWVKQVWMTLLMVLMLLLFQWDHNIKPRMCKTRHMLGQNTSWVQVNVYITPPQ